MFCNLNNHLYTFNLITGPAEKSSHVDSDNRADTQHSERVEANVSPEIIQLDESDGDGRDKTESGM